MRLNQRNRRKYIYWAPLVSSEYNPDLGDIEYVYGEPIKIKVNLSPSVGNSWTNIINKDAIVPYGIREDFQKAFIVPEEIDGLDQTSAVWVDLPHTGPHDYRVIGWASDPWCCRYSLERVYIEHS